MMPSAGPNSGPMRFCPPSPRDSERYAACTPAPRDNHTRSCVSSSSGWAPITSTRLLAPSCSSAFANAATPPVPAGDSACPHPVPTAPIRRKRLVQVARRTESLRERYQGTSPPGPLSPSLRSGRALSGEGERSGSDVHDAAFHHEFDPLQLGDVLERIARHRHEVGGQALCHGAEI